MRTASGTGQLTTLKVPHNPIRYVRATLTRDAAQPWTIAEVRVLPLSGRHPFGGRVEPRHRLRSRRPRIVRPMKGATHATWLIWVIVIVVVLVVIGASCR